MTTTHAMRLRYVICDVFTDTPLTGNPLAVFTNSSSLDTGTMQALAREMNLSETVFVLPSSGDAHARVRIFTPREELPFAGHPVLGTAFVLGRAMEGREVRLELAIGTVAVRLEREGPHLRFGWMTQPEPKLVPVEQEANILRALGLARASLPVAAYHNGPTHVCIAVETRERVTDLAPRFEELASATRACVNVFCLADGVCRTRMFAPAAGIFEDPATGSAAGPIAVHLVRHGLLAPGTELRLEQGAEIQRPSTLYARVNEESGQLHVEVGGSAVILARGEVELPRSLVPLRTVSRRPQGN